MGWIGAEIEAHLKNHEDFEKCTEKLVEIEVKHFGDILVCNWVNQVFSSRLAFRISPERIKAYYEKYGHCGYCTNYIGVGMIKQRLHKNVKVLHSYCGYRGKVVSPEERCMLYDPKEFWKGVILWEIHHRDYLHIHGLVLNVQRKGDKYWNENLGPEIFQKGGK